jgi:hypothetical protein
MVLVYNSFKNESCKNLKRERDEENIYESRYKKLRKNLEKKGLVEVNQDFLSEQFNKICKIEKKEMEIIKEIIVEEEIEDETEDETEDEIEDETETEYDYETANEYYSDNEIEETEIDEEHYNIIKEIEGLIQ